MHTATRDVVNLASTRHADSSDFSSTVTIIVANQSRLSLYPCRTFDARDISMAYCENLGRIWNLDEAARDCQHQRKTLDFGSLCSNVCCVLITRVHSVIRFRLKIIRTVESSRHERALLGGRNVTFDNLSEHAYCWFYIQVVCIDNAIRNYDEYTLDCSVSFVVFCIVKKYYDSSISSDCGNTNESYRPIK